MQMTPISEDLTRYLAAHGLGEGSAFWQGIRRAIGAAPGESLTSDVNPVYGYYLQTLERSPATVLLYLVTAGRFIRYEWSMIGEVSSEVVTTFPVDRIASVEEVAVGSQLTVAVFFDSSVSVSAGRATTRTGPDPDSADDDTVGAVEWTSRREGLVYRLSAAGDPDQAQKLLELAGFSRALRLTVGA